MAGLTKSKIEAIRRPGRFGDSPGLHLLVSRVMTKSWVLRIMVNGKRVDRGLGRYPETSIEQARQKAATERSKVKNGEDLQLKSNRETFQEIALKVMEFKKGLWKNPQQSRQWRRWFEMYVFPSIGTKAIQAITSDDVLNLIMPVWNKKPVTGKKVLQAVNVIMKWSVVRDLRSTNPVESLKSVLPMKEATRNTKHFAALEAAEIPHALQTLRKTRADRMATLLLEFQILTCVRPVEARGARWDEIDQHTAIWSIPKGRMKNGKGFEIPMSSRCLEILTEAKQSRKNDFIFPGKNGVQSKNGLTKLLRVCGFDATSHGMRSAFRGWAAQHQIPFEIAEGILCHSLGSIHEAYQRNDLLQLRRAVMEQWAAYLNQ